MRIRLTLRCATVGALSLFFFAACDSVPRADAAMPPPGQETPPDLRSAGEVAQAQPESQPTSQPESQPTSQPSGAAAPAVDTTTELAAAPADWVDARVNEARDRLARTEAGQLVWASIEAHGGLRTWFANGPIFFRFNYAPTDRAAIDTRQLVDTWTSRAAHSLPANADVGFGWDGNNAWVSDPEAELPSNPRFWALTPYYFVGLPFVLADSAVALAPAGEMTVEGVVYDLVRATFGADAGDAPDDYYILLVERGTARMGGVRYVVSYPGFFPDGGHSPEKLLKADGEQIVGGISLPTSYRTFALTLDAEDPGAAPVLGAVVTNTTLTEVEFRPETPSSAFDVPQGATIVEGY